jgi:two-component SAPR family response regulator
MKIVYMSGYLEHESDELFVSDAEQLQKPFSRESLLQKLRAAAKQEETRSSSRQPLQPA